MTTDPAMNQDSIWKQAARYGDADAEEHGLEPAIRKQGIDFEAFKYLADQRALRVVLMGRPGFDPFALDHAFAVELDPFEKAAHIRFQACYWDGLYIGWRARGLAEAREVTSAGALDAIGECLNYLAFIDEKDHEFVARKFGGANEGTVDEEIITSVGMVQGILSDLYDRLEGEGNE